MAQRRYWASSFLELGLVADGTRITQGLRLQKRSIDSKANDCNAIASFMALAAKPTTSIQRFLK
jgi:hypothetical protein